MVLDPEKKRELVLVHGDGRRVDDPLTHPSAVEYAKATARAFGIDTERATDHRTAPDREVDFDRELAKKDFAGDGFDAGGRGKRSAGKKSK